MCTFLLFKPNFKHYFFVTYCIVMISFYHKYNSISPLSWLSFFFFSFFLTKVDNR